MAHGDVQHGGLISVPLEYLERGLYLALTTRRVLVGVLMLLCLLNGALGVALWRNDQKASGMLERLSVIAVALDTSLLNQDNLKHEIRVLQTQVAATPTPCPSLSQ